MAQANPILKCEKLILLEEIPAIKECKFCHQILSLELFSKHQSCKFGRRNYCKVCVSKKYNEADRLYKKKYQQRPEVQAARRLYLLEHREKIQKQRKAYYQQHQEKLRAYSRKRRQASGEELRNSHRLYVKNHPEQFRLYAAKRRALKRRVEYEKIDTYALWKRDRGKCGICKKSVKYQEMSIDHILPLSRGGTHTNHNCQPAHRGCNLQKGAGRLPSQLRLRI